MNTINVTSILIQTWVNRRELYRKKLKKLSQHSIDARCLRAQIKVLDECIKNYEGTQYGQHK